MEDTFLPQKSPEISRVEITWTELHYSVLTKAGKTDILKGISGAAESGEFLAIMGSSGAGKTTLLNFLSNRVQKTSTVSFSGEVYANNQNIQELSYKTYIGYVTQEDILIDCLTVKESLMFSAQLRIAGSVQSIEAKVDSLIDELKLETCKDTFIGSRMIKGISGGERKRTSIGIELVTDPSVLFLDEPTSGLDSNTAFVVVSLLLSQAKKGRTVITTIHQPSSDIFHKFDKLLLMADGYIVYHGEANMGIEYFKRAGHLCPVHSNPADFFIEILHIQKPHDLTEDEAKRINALKGLYVESSLVVNKRSFDLTKLLEKSSLRPSGFFFQLYMNTKRFGLRVLRNPLLSIVKLFIMAFNAAMINIFYHDLGTHGQGNYRSRNGVLFFTTMSLTFSNVQGSVLSFPLMRSLMIKEYNSNMYGIAAFFLAKNIIDLIFDFIFSILYGNMIYWGVGLTTESFLHVFYFFAFCFMIHLTGGSLGFFCGSLFKRPEVAMSFTSMVILPFMYFSGFYRNDNIPDAFRWIENISSFKYAFQGLAKNEWDGVGNPVICPKDVPCEETALDLLGITMSVRKSLYLLFVIMVFFRLLALANLIIVVRRNKS